MPGNKKIKLNFKKFKISFGLDADKDWHFVAIIACIITIIGVAFNLFAYLHFVYFTNEVVVEKSDFNFLDNKKIEEVIKNNEEKKIQFENIQESLHSR